MSIFFNGLYGAFDHTTPTVKIPKGPKPRVFPGHVLEICMDPNSDLFESQKDIGKIRFRNLLYDLSRPDKLCISTAMPLDRSMARYPFPGEEVLIFQAFGEKERLLGAIIEDTYFYSFVISLTHNITANTYPFLEANYKQVDPSKLFPSKAIEEIRLDKKIEDLEMLKPLGTKDIVIRKQLQPHEGDFILQGRFGNTIRMAGSSAKTKTGWSKEGMSGDGIMMIRVEKDSTTKSENMLIEENIDTDDASIYLCTSQQVPFTLGCSKILSTWAQVFGIKENTTGTSGASISTTTDTYQPAWKKLPTVDGLISFDI